MANFTTFFVRIRVQDIPVTGMPCRIAPVHR